jgi:hypothetical protein
MERATTRGESDVAAGSDGLAVTEDRLSAERSLADRDTAGRASAERTTKIAASRQSGGGSARRTDVSGAAAPPRTGTSAAT